MPLIKTSSHTTTSLLWRLLPFLLLSVAGAEEIKVPLVGLGWQIAFRGPTLEKSSMDYKGGVIKFRAMGSRFNVSVFVEPPPSDPKDGSHAACRDFYWTQSKRNPSIVTTSIQMGGQATCEYVAYRTQEKMGRPVVQDHINCYFVHKGKWVDVHASVLEPTPEDTEGLKAFAAKLTYGGWEASNGEPKAHVLDTLGTAKLAIPAGWLHGNLLKDYTDEDSTKFTVSFYSPTNPNSFGHLTLFAGPKTFDSAESLRSELENATSGIARHSLEGKAVIRELKLKQGIGAVSSFTDASLVGKPAEPGNSKTIVSGLISPRPKVLGVVSLYADDAEGEDARKMLQALESLTLE